MANFAQLDDDNNVLQVIVVNDSDCLDKDGNESEAVGVEFCQSLFGGRWMQTSFNRNMRVNFAGVGMKYYPEIDAFMKPKPHPWYELGEAGEWERPWYMNDETGEPFTEDQLKYIFYYIRNTKSYRFCPAVPKAPSDEFLFKACTSNDFMYPTYEGLMYGSNRTQEIAEAKIEGEKIIIPFVHTLRKEIDLTPIGIILEVRWEGLNPDIAAASLNAHPQTASRTRQELFRLIIEWAFAHTDLGNNEPAAIGCHNILRQVQMPLEVRNELLTQIEPQAVECYLRGEFPFKNTDFETLQDPPSPPLFTAWYYETRKKFPALLGQETSLNVDMDNLPESYPK